MKSRNENAITLVALVVTIIILLILATISINLVLGENGIISRSKEAEKISKLKNSEEIIKLSVLESNDKNGQLNIENVNNSLEKINGLEKVRSDDFPLLVCLNNNYFKIDKMGNVDHVNMNNDSIFDKIKVGDYIAYDTSELPDTQIESESARHIGTDPNNPNGNQMVSDELMADGYRAVETKDLNIAIDGGDFDNEDATCRIPRNLRAIGKNYFVASRLGWFENGSGYETRLFDAYGNKSHVIIAASGGYYQYDRRYGTRPIIRLKTDIKIIDGDGKTLDSAYVIIR